MTVAALTALARVPRVPYPILLVVGGSLVGFAPLLFNAAYFSSLRDLRAHMRAITLGRKNSSTRSVLFARGDLRDARRAGADPASADPPAGDRGGRLARVRGAASAAIEHLNRLADENWTRDDTVERVTRFYELRLRRVKQRAGKLDIDGEDGDLNERSAAHQRVAREVLGAQRARIIELRDEGVISDGVLYALERELDLEDQRLEI